MYNKFSENSVLFEQNAEIFASSSDDQITHSVVDRNVLDELTLGDSDLLCELIGIYLEQFEQQLQEIETAIKTNDSESLFAMAHKAVGGNATFGMTGVVPALRELEKMGREARFDGGAELLILIRREFVVIAAECQAILNEKSL